MQRHMIWTRDKMLKTRSGIVLVSNVVVLSVCAEAEGSHCPRALGKRLEHCRTCPAAVSRTSAFPRIREPDDPHDCAPDDWQVDAYGSGSRTAFGTTALNIGAAHVALGVAGVKDFSRN